MDFLRGNRDHAGEISPGLDMTDPLSFAAMRCLLFVPGNRPDRFAKAQAASPDGILIDLEDAVPAAEKASARAAAAAFLNGRDVGAPVLVRINMLGSRVALDDLAALADGTLAPDGLVLPKVEDARDIELVRALVPDLALLAMIESARGLAQADSIARGLRATDALGFGGADLAADLGAALDWDALLHARSSLVRSAALCRLALLDVPFFDIAALHALSEETRRARALGYTGKFAIHPTQVAPIRAAFAPTEDEIAQANRILAGAIGGGVTVVDGRMVDAPIIAAARRILQRAGRTA